MIVGTFMFHSIFLYAVAVLPTLNLQDAFFQKDLQRAERWCAYLTCVVTFIIPLLYIPYYIPFRNDVVVLMLILLTMFDASIAHLIIQRYVTPVTKQLKIVTMLIKVGLAEDVATKHHSVHNHRASESDSSDDEKNEGEGTK